MKTTFGIVGLTLVYILITVAICYGLAIYYEKAEEKRERKFWEHIKNNNTWFFMLLGAIPITLIIALCNFGPSLFLPEKFPSKEIREVIANIGYKFLHWKSAPEKVAEDLPWATGTWFWWKAWAFYVIALFLYTPFALADEFAGFCKGVKRIIEEHRDRKEEEIHGPPPTPPAAPAAGGHGAAAHEATTTPRVRVSFWELLSVELIGEVLSEFAIHFMKKSR